MEPSEAARLVAATTPTAEAADVPVQVHIEQLRQWGFTVIPGVIAPERLAAVGGEVEAFQSAAREHYSTVTGMSEETRAAMLERPPIRSPGAGSPAQRMAARQLASVSGGATAEKPAAEQLAGEPDPGWREAHITEAASYERATPAHEIVSQAAFVPQFAECLSEPRVLAVARAVLDQHCRIAQVEALGKSIHPGSVPHNNMRGWQCAAPLSNAVASLTPRGCRVAAPTGRTISRLPATKGSSLPRSRTWLWRYRPS